MLRTASTVCLSAWTAFLALGTTRLLIEAQVFPAGVQPALEELLGMIRQGEALGVGVSGAEPFAALLVAIGVVFGISILRLNSCDRHLAASGEQVAVAGLVAIFAFWLSATLAGSPVAELFGSGTGVCLALAFTLGALLFDHMMQADESESDEAFEAILRQIENQTGSDRNDRSE
ncbi:hypothetical protein [Fulvimarina sp. MAC8]|uniref:hypothetical protein n=1 Tax=Fulvimarina sp. MAC8 TaxID=3162874 RepID=UPI0032EC2EFC